MDKLLKTKYGDLRTLFDLLPDYIYFKDSQSRFIDANLATLRIMKCRSLQDCIGKTDFNFYPQQFAKKYFSDEQEIIRTGQPKLDIEEVTPDEHGQLGFYSTSKVPLKDNAGRITGVIGIGRNITDRKKAQQLTMQREIDKVSRLSDIGTLATSVAHELRNPLEVIKLSATMLKKDKALVKNKYLNSIDKKLCESQRIIDNLLNYSRIKSPIYEQCDLVSLVEESIEVFAGHGEDQKIHLHKEYFVRQLPIEVDPYQIKQVFINIFNNAQQAILKKQGNITITIRQQGQEACVAFKDDGMGIQENNLAKLFTPFYTSKRTGTGLGLSICKELVSLHHGTIEVQSKPENGTTFRIILPLQKPRLPYTVEVGSLPGN